MNFYQCKTCNSIFTFLGPLKAPLSCCNAPLEEMPLNKDGAPEKHIPVYRVLENEVTVEIGRVPHPMLLEHHIERIMLETQTGYQRKDLKPGDLPQAKFLIEENEPILAVYDYCNIHGLWKND